MNSDNVSLKNKTIKGLGWSAIENISRLGISFIVGIILARLLSPYEYGLIGILTIFISIFNAIVDGGFTIALIRKQNATDKDYCTAFYTNLALSFVLALTLFLCGGVISTFFERPELAAMTRVMSSIVLINALAIVQRVRLSKIIDFKTQTIITIVSSVISGTTGIIMAYCDYGVWSLVWQQIVNQIVSTIILWIHNRWAPSFLFSITSFKEMWSFGSKLMAVTMIDTAWKQVYQVVIGKFYSPVALGLYTRAEQFSIMFSQNLTSVVQRVTYPVLSTIQDDIPRLKSGYKRIIKCSMLISFVLMLGMAACARTMILTLIGEKWIECVPYLQLICITAMTYPLHALNLNMLQVQGRSDLFLKLEIIKKCILVGPILVGIYVNIYWMLISSIFTTIISYYLNAYYSGSYINYSIKEQVKDILPSLFVASAMAILVFLMDYLPIKHFILFPLQTIAGAVITVVLCETFKLEEYYEIKSILLPKLIKIIKR